MICERSATKKNRVSPINHSPSLSPTVLGKIHQSRNSTALYLFPNCGRLVNNMWSFVRLGGKNLLFPLYRFSQNIRRCLWIFVTTFRSGCGSSVLPLATHSQQRRKAHCIMATCGKTDTTFWSLTWTKNIQNCFFYKKKSRFKRSFKCRRFIVFQNCSRKR